jgi:predicted nuclease of predicted toxin-antitoxin system
MTVKLYMDEHVPGPITTGLRSRLVDVLTAQEEFREGNDDEQVLDRATELQRVLFTCDSDFFQIVTSKQAAGQQVAGVFTIPISKLTYRQCIDDLEMVAKCSEYEEWEGRITRLPLTT